jgi:cytochrome c oxidase subunit 3
LSADTHHSPVLKHHFNNLEQQHSAERLGMWMFLVTEVLFFGGLFCAYTVYRWINPVEFELASSHLILWVAAVNTALLITSSVTATFAIRCAQLGDRAGLLRNLWITLLLGAGFMCFKAYEYSTDYHEKLVPGTMFQQDYDAALKEIEKAKPADPKGYKFEGHYGPASVDLAKRNYGKSVTDPEYVRPGRVQLFLCFYYIMTGIHGVHILVGLGCLAWLIIEAKRGKIPPENYSTVEVVSLYWHLVDMIWLFLMPLLYLAGASMGHGH